MTKSRSARRRFNKRKRLLVQAVEKVLKLNADRQAGKFDRKAEDDWMMDYMMCGCFYGEWCNQCMGTKEPTRCKACENIYTWENYCPQCGDELTGLFDHSVLNCGDDWCDWAACRMLS